MSSRNFLREYTAMFDGTEIPPLFSLWCGLFGVAATLGRKVYIDMGTFPIYPNFYVILVAGSGRCRKSTAIRQIDKLLRESCCLNQISQKLTPQSLIEAMNEMPEGVIHMPNKVAEGVITVDEMANFLNKASYEAGMAPMLISFYDCENNFEYRTKSRGKETVKDSCLNILAGTTIDWLRGGIPSDAVGGGLTSRMIFVYVDTPQEPVPFPSITPRQAEARVWAGLDLKRIEKLKGKMQLDPKAKEMCSTEYIDFYKNSPMYEQQNLSGYASRRGIHLLKIAALLSIIESSDLVIKPPHITGALKALTLTERMLPDLIKTIASTDVGNNAEFVLHIVTSARQISRSDLMRKVSHKLDARGLDEVLKTLLGSSRIQPIAVGNSTFYVAS